MKVTKRIAKSVENMYAARDAWEEAKAKASGNPRIGEGWLRPKVEYLPGTGFAINGVTWPYTSDYIINHFDQMTADYKAQTALYVQAAAIADEANDASDIPF